jgi:hypothetical protein
MMAKHPTRAPNTASSTARTPQAAATTTVESGPTETGSLTYKRLAPDDPPAVEVGGRAFVEGKAVQIDDPRLFAKLSRNPYFGGGEAPQRAARTVDPALAEAQNKAAEELVDLRQEASEANANLSAAQRAQQTLAAIAEAQTSSDRDPPLTNHARNSP